MPKKERQLLLKKLVETDPFLTDEELSKRYDVSVQTIRLDRLECGIPELRKRLKRVASQSMAGEVKSLSSDEIIGDIIDIELDKRALSIFDVTIDHVFQRSGIARGHHLFAQANSLAVAVMDEDLALTVKSTIDFLKPVKVGDRVIARAEVKNESNMENRTLVDVVSKVGDVVVFTGQFYMYRTTERKQEELL
ncbi:transcription factor FapR [Sporosarcina sp. Marseille-Q4063]|uniref:transcription factor FapR n=1 Tax=Sporosarcina sp. Marseille-Q4063 TaxID=2810514 RepID=UPI001BAED8B1|nr:transcription factor FapR [Sporosarcina sp. Marseille-Q4063]QUW21841.1 transcription factor FapR [Sporosarcina sp. Marseille-Q4063]